MTIINSFTAAAKPTSQHFTRTEARGKIGTRVEARGAGCIVPAGTVGTVIRAEEFKPGEYDLVVRWDRVACYIGGALQPVHEWFIRSEYNLRLREVGYENVIQFPSLQTLAKEVLNVV